MPFTRYHLSCALGATHCSRISYITHTHSHRTPHSLAQVHHTHLSCIVHLSICNAGQRSRGRSHGPIPLTSRSLANRFVRLLAHSPFHSRIPIPLIWRVPLLINVMPPTPFSRRGKLICVRDHCLMSPCRYLAAGFSASVSQRASLCRPECDASS